MNINMQGRLSKCYLLAYRTPSESVRGLLPAGLELVTRGPWAFWNVVVCEVEKMRLAGLPRCVGVSYRHVAYRLYVKAATANQGRMRGLYFVRSDADHTLVSRGGNVASDFRFHPATIALRENEGNTSAAITNTANGEADAFVQFSPGEAELAGGSCFESLEEARAVLKYQPLGLSLSKNGRTLKLAEVFRNEAAWHESFMHVETSRFAFFERLGQTDLHLEMATQVAPIDYRWRLGRREAMAVDHGLVIGSPASFQTRKPPSIDQTLV